MPIIRRSAVCLVFSISLAFLAAAQDRCAQYAQRAVEQYQLMRSHPNCRIPDDPRWQANFQNHYQGCRVALKFVLAHEEKARDAHLKACGGMTEGTTVSSDSAQLGHDAATTLDEMLNMPAGVITAGDIPVGLIMCGGNDCDTKNFGTWIFQGVAGVARWPAGQVAKLTILKFDATSVIVRREDQPNSTSPGFVAIYEGTRHGDRVDGQVRATWPGHFPTGKTPGMVTFGFYATIPQTKCDSADQTLQDALELGQTAVRFRQPTSAFQCFTVAAKQGNAEAKGIVGLMYRDGIGTNQDPTQGIKWLRDGANQGDYNSQVVLAEMYNAGIGTATDPQQAQYWQAKAQRNPVLLRQQAAAQQQQDMQKFALMGIAALVEAMATPDVVIVRQR